MFTETMNHKDLVIQLQEMESRLKSQEAANADLTEKLVRKAADETGAPKALAPYVCSDTSKMPTQVKAGIGANVILRGFDIDEFGNAMAPAWEGDAPRPVAHIKGYLDDADTKDPDQIRLQDLVSRRQLARRVQRAARPDQPPSTPLFDALLRRELDRQPEAIRKAFVDTAGVGGEWIVVDNSPDVIRAAETLYPRSVEAGFRHIPLARDTLYPLYLNPGVPYLHGVTGNNPASFRSSDITTGSFQTALQTIAAMLQAGMDASEESLVNADQMLSEALAYTIMSAREDAIINGQKSTTSVDTGLAAGWNPNSIYSATPSGGSLDHRKAWNGLRHVAIDNSNTVDWSTITVAAWILALAKTDGPNLGDMMIIGSKLGIAKNLESLEFPTGRAFLEYLRMIEPGLRIIKSRLMTDDLNTAGIYDGSTMTKTGALVINPAEFIIFDRYMTRVEVWRDPTSGLLYYIAKTRAQFAPIRSTSKGAYYGYNMAKA